MCNSIFFFSFIGAHVIKIRPPTQACIHLSLLGAVSSPLNLICIFLDYWRKPERLNKSHPPPAIHRCQVKAGHQQEGPSRVRLGHPNIWHLKAVWNGNKVPKTSAPVSNSERSNTMERTAWLFNVRRTLSSKPQKSTEGTLKKTRDSQWAHAW